MRYTKSLLAALVLTLGLVAQGYAAPAGFKEHKLDGMTVSIPSAWELAPKEALAQLEKQASGVKPLMAAQGDVDGFPKLTILRKQQETLSQADFIKMDENAVKNMCSQFESQVTSTQGATEFVCKRFTADKGTALLTQFNIPKAGVTSISYMFFQGPKEITVISGIIKATDGGKLLPVIENVAKSVKLGK